MSSSLMPVRLSILLLCGACSAIPSPPIAPPRPLAEIQVELRHRLPTVEVSISGKPFRLFLDLGGHRGIALTTQELEGAPVRFSGASQQFRNARGEILKSREFSADDVRLGDFALGTVEGGESIFGGEAPPDRNGYIGMPVLGRFLLVLDYPARRIRLYNSGDTAAFEFECGARHFSVAKVNGIAQSVGETEFGERLFLWDTGSTDNVLRPAALPPDKAAGRRIDDGPPVITLEKITLGGIDIGPQEFRVIPFQAPAVDAYLGTGVFATHKVCLDIPQGKGAVR